MDILLDIAETNSDGQKSIKAVIEEIEGKEEYDVSLPKSIITKDTDDIVIEIETPVASVKMPSNMIDDEDTGTGESINLAIAKVDKETLSTEAKAKVGDRPIIKVELKKGDESINWSNPDAPITISVPYTPTAEELENPELIVIYYIDSSGELQTVPTGKYNPATGKVTFQTTHLSEYAIGYNYKTFADIGDIAWAQSNIEVLASRGIIKGVDDDTFLPSANISRADFAILLVRALGLNADFTVNFTGINETDYFYNETGIAKELGIIKGYSDGTFKPRDYITRQDMIVMADRAMTVANRSVNSGSLFDIANYLDSDLVADYALNAVTNFVENGLIIGNNQKLKPLDNTTRAEAAVLIYRLYNYQ
jgi:copper chaperone CopZ